LHEVFEIFLQGSYANTTNIYGDSDVDVVVLHTNTFHYDLSRLSPTEQQRHGVLFRGIATYQWPHLRNDVLDALRAHFGVAAVVLGKKSIKVQTATGRRPSDVVPALQYRRYATLPDGINYTAHWGIQFFDSGNNPIVNYPKYHVERGEEKNQEARTRKQYKATVRVFKNFRNALIDRRLLTAETAPSYFLECALHNVTDNLFIGRFSDTVPAIINHLLSAPHGTYLCQNGIVPLFGSGLTQWSEAQLGQFVAAAVKGWNTW